MVVEPPEPAACRLQVSETEQQEYAYTIGHVLFENGAASVGGGGGRRRR